MQTQSTIVRSGGNGDSHFRCSDSDFCYFSHSQSISFNAVEIEMLSTENDVDYDYFSVGDTDKGCQWNNRQLLTSASINSSYLCLLDSPRTIKLAILRSVHGYLPSRHFSSNRRVPTIGRYTSQ